MTAAAQLLDELESSLAEQLALAQADDVAAASAILDRTSQLIAALDGADAGNLDCGDQLRRIAQLHDQIRLCMATSKQATSDQLRQMRNSRQVLRTYGPSSRHG